MITSEGSVRLYTNGREKRKLRARMERMISKFLSEKARTVVRSSNGDANCQSWKTTMEIYDHMFFISHIITECKMPFQPCGFF